MSSVNLNLARKWRSKNFDQVVGQDLSVRMLKNSLYLNQYFPVYLFSGQRGCGKTTTARIFASAINCEQLAEFQKNPKLVTLPCLACASCIMMAQGKHPDFIEIDAASHTGVDNVRQIIDAASLLPLMGRKKIYLIDEAHMLSKAAFNAFLKILEEPPMSVLFILATTDAQKIIDTVKSRCFQLFFRSIDAQPLATHLQNVCIAEEIAYDDAGLAVIVKESEGSVRDALNMLEQVRFASDKVTKPAVLQVLGQLDDDRLINLFDTVVHQKPAAVLKYLQELAFSSRSAEFVWYKLVELIRASLWIKYDVQPEHFVEYIPQIKAILRDVSAKKLCALLELFYDQEQLFLKTTAKHALLEMILLRVAQKNGDDNSNSGIASMVQPTDEAVQDQQTSSEDEEEDDDVEDDKDNDEESDEHNALWQEYVLNIDGLNDPLLSSLFKQAQFIGKVNDTGMLDVAFSKDFIFFKEWLADTQKLWQPLLSQTFGTVTLNPHFTLETKPLVQEEKRVTVQSSASRPAIQSSSIARSSHQQVQQKPQVQSTWNIPTVRTSNWQQKKAAQQMPIGKTVDISAVEVWKKAQLLTRYFPGTITEQVERLHE